VDIEGKSDASIRVAKEAVDALAQVSPNCTYNVNKWSDDRGEDGYYTSVHMDDPSDPSRPQVSDFEEVSDDDEELLCGDAGDEVEVEERWVEWVQMLTGSAKG